jgi:hypothetical protein
MIQYAKSRRRRPHNSWRTRPRHHIGIIHTTVNRQNANGMNLTPLLEATASPKW